MKIGRRGFMGSLAAATAAAAVLGIDDPERLLWVPGARKIFLPSHDIVKAEDQAVAEIQRAYLKRGTILTATGGRYVVTMNAHVGGYRQAHFDADWKPIGISDPTQLAAINAEFFGGVYTGRNNDHPSWFDARHKVANNSAGGSILDPRGVTFWKER